MDTITPASHRIHVATTIIVGILVIALVALTFYVSSLKDQNIVGPPLAGPNDKQAQVVRFMDDFINLVLDAPGEVDFDTRLRLENEVRDTKDAEILAAWKAFTDSKTEDEAQDRVVDLLKILVARLRTN